MLAQHVSVLKLLEPGRATLQSEDDFFVQSRVVYPFLAKDLASGADLLASQVTLSRLNETEKKVKESSFERRTRPLAAAAQLCTTVTMKSSSSSLSAQRKFGACLLKVSLTLQSVKSPKCSLTWHLCTVTTRAPLSSQSCLCATWSALLHHLSPYFSHPHLFVFFKL